MNYDCYGCHKQLNADHFSKRQLAGETANRRCKGCVEKRIGDPGKELKAKKLSDKYQEEARLRRERFTEPPDPSPICMNCASETLPLKVFFCPFCIASEYPCNKTKLVTCPSYKEGGSRDCIAKTISQHFHSGNCLKVLEVQEITISYTRRPVDAYDDGDEENIESTLLYPVRSLDTKLSEIERWFYPKRSMFPNDNPSYQLEGLRGSEEKTIGEILDRLYYDQAIKIRFCGV